ELRERAQQGFARDSRCRPEPRNQRGEGVGKGGGQIGPRRIITRRELAQILLWCDIDIARDLDMRPTIAHISGFYDPSAGQFSLEAEFPPLIVWRERIGVEEGNVLPKEGSRPVSRPHWFLDPIREWIGQRPGEVHTIDRRNQVGVPAEPALVDVSSA